MFHRLVQIPLKFLTVVFISGLFPAVFAQDSSITPAEDNATQKSKPIIKQSNNNTYLRLIVPTKRGSLEFQQDKNIVNIIPLYVDGVAQLQEMFSQLGPDPSYIKKIELKEPNNKINIAHIELTLARDDLEMFSFYQDAENGHIMDFWSNRKLAEVKDDKATLEEKPAPIVAAPVVTKAEILVEEKKSTEIKRESRATIEKKTLTAPVVSAHPGWRDFRYGATFIFPLHPLAPEFKQIIDLDRKTPEVFYPIKDREYLKDEKEAHLQLVINLYRKSSWGHMYKAMKLYTEKYGADSNEDIIEYLKANALLLENLKKGDTAPVKTAITIFENIALRTKIYELRKAINKYLISHFVRLNDHVRSLKIAKQYYVDTKDNFDYEETPYSLETIIYNLSMLNQDEKIDQLLAEKTVSKLMPRQLLLGHQMYTLLKLDKHLEVIRIYEKEQATFARPINGMILYNAAEAYFRNAQYEQAVGLFDDFVSTYSHHSKSASARLRLALSYDLLDREPEQTIELYKQVIDRSHDPLIRYEAQIRYVALTSIRKIKPTAEDLEKRVFLDHSFNEKTLVNSPLLKLLWQVRLRTFVFDRKFNDGLVYLRAIPISTLKISEIKSFEADGAEIVLGMILSDYSKADYASVIRNYENYHSRYMDKVAIDPLVNFMVAKSYIKLGLYTGYDSLMVRFSKIKNTPVKTYPIWIDRPSIRSPEYLMAELEVIRHVRMKEWQKASSAVLALGELDESGTRQDFYKGIIHFHLKDYKAAISQIESFIAGNSDRELVDEIERADLIEAYAGSLYETRQLEKYKKVVNAIRQTHKMNNETYLGKVVEKIQYLYIELLAADMKTSAPIIGKEIETFQTRYPVSPYQGRLQLLLGQAFMAQEQVNEAIAVLDKILKDDKISGHIKEMARSEMTMARIRQRTI